MVKDIVLLAIGGAFGLGATLMATAAPFYLDAPAWVWHSLFWGGLTLMALMVVDALILLLGGGRFWAAGPAALANVGLLALAAAVIWQTAKTTDTSSSSSAVERSLDYSISIECSIGRLPARTPESGTFYLIGLWGGQPVGARYSGVPGSELQGLTGGHYESTRKCSITNLWQRPIINVQAEITIESHDPSHEDNSVAPGAVATTHTERLPEINLDVGTREAFDFYIYNFGDNWAHIILPETIKFQRVGTDKWEAAKLIHRADPLSLWLPPRAVDLSPPTSPPVASPPSPAPPVSPAGK